MTDLKLDEIRHKLFMIQQQLCAIERTFEVIPEFYIYGKLYLQNAQVVHEDKVYIALFDNSDQPGHTNEWLERTGYGTYLLIDGAHLQEAYILIKKLLEMIGKGDLNGLDAINSMVEKMEL